MKTLFSERLLCNIPKCPKCKKRLILVSIQKCKKNYYICINDNCKNYQKTYYIKDGKLYSREFKIENVVLEDLKEKSKNDEQIELKHLKVITMILILITTILTLSGINSEIHHRKFEQIAMNYFNSQFESGETNVSINKIYN